MTHPKNTSDQEDKNQNNQRIKKKSNDNQCYFANLIDDRIFVIADRLSLIKIDIFITLYRIIIY